MTRATAHQLRKWRRLLMVRDSRPVNPQAPEKDQLRLGICVLCGESVFYRVNQLQAHHIRPMSLYPARELQLSNGVMLCAGHHLGIVHSHNASLDARRTDDFQNGWRAFVVMFDRFVGLAQNRDYNAANQSRL